MRVLFSPQRCDDTINYVFGNEIIHVTYKGKNEMFDFSDMPDGIAESIETSLEINPVLSAWRDNGTLYVELLKFLGPDASESERFPDWEVIE